MITNIGRKLAHEIDPKGEAFGLNEQEILSRIHRLAVTYTRIQELWCNEEMSERRTAYLQRREAQIENRIKAHAAKLPGVTVVKFDGDPRGYVVKLMLASGHYNTWGGTEEGWGIA